MSPDARRSPPDLLHFGFSQDNGCFACGTSSGFRVYNCEPFQEMVGERMIKGCMSSCFNPLGGRSSCAGSPEQALAVQFRREFDHAGIGMVEMPSRCHILAPAGRGSAPRFPPNKVGTHSPKSEVDLQAHSVFEEANRRSSSSGLPLRCSLEFLGD